MFVGLRKHRFASMEAATSTRDHPSLRGFGRRVRRIVQLRPEPQLPPIQGEFGPLLIAYLPPRHSNA